MSCGVLIKKAKIATFGSRVEDIFFITDYKHQALYSADQLDCLREKISLLLDEDMPKQATLWITKLDQTKPVDLPNSKTC